MKSAEQVVALLLETPTVRVCSQCEQNRIARGVGPVPVEAGVQKNYGFCKRHYLEQLRSFGLDDMIARYEQQPDETFSPDLGESIPPVADQVAKATGFTFSPKEQAGAISLAGLSPDETAMLTRNLSWEFTDKRPDSPTVGFTFYVKANTPYEQIMQEYQQRLAKWNEDAASVEKRKQEWERSNPAFRSSLQ